MAHKAFGKYITRLVFDWSKRVRGKFVETISWSISMVRFSGCIMRCCGLAIVVAGRVQRLVMAF